MSKSTFPVNGEAMPAAPFAIADLTDRQTERFNRNPAMIHGEASVGTKPRSSANALRSQIMTEAHTRAKADYADELSCRGRAHHVNRPYSYYLGLQMRSGFAEARVARTGMAQAFELPAQRWA
ncbi:hypothetical protein IVB34_40175 [Bradyrhizobium sp. 2]|uniref:hypothetical protein n=1 Tax=unclassified Bradyrhizobium TaxID=2631580 RepID=UPI001FF9738C|nr:MULTISPECIES: hypothetical protein [unclassified Bradyrhizobium]MCK1447245.1 hypothetical protein [Bradyrhizobium sp. 48]MCK1464409.1 hypothetical protein [Bradyrhizobium sp. 2]